MIDSLISQCSRGQYWLRFPYHGQEAGWSGHWWVTDDPLMGQLSDILLSITIFLLPQTHKAIARENYGETVSV